MSIQKLKDASDKILTRLPAVTGRGEEATKQALILPMLEALGYDIWNPAEVCPEYQADFAIKKTGQKEKVDYAIFINHLPRIYIEVKPYRTELDGHQGQLARYFNSTPTVSLAIMTNGTEYKLYTDTGDPNIMDVEPFHTVNLEHQEQGLEIFARFQKEHFSPEITRDFASEIQYTTKMVNFFRSELDIRDLDPSDSLVKWVMSNPGMFDGRLTSNALDRFRPIVKTALQKVLREIVRRSLVALDEEVSAPATMTPTINEVIVQPAIVQSDTAVDGGAKIITTEAELECFAIIKRQFESLGMSKKTINDPSSRKEVSLEVNYKDTTQYFGIYLNKPGWWVARLVTESKRPWIGFDLEPENARFITPPEYEVLEEIGACRFRVGINKPSDLEGLKELIKMAFKHRVEQVKSGKTSSE